MNKYLLIGCAALLAACTDDPIYEDVDVGEGTVNLSAAVQFEPQADALDSRATPGNAIRDINTLSVILYSQTDTLNPMVYNFTKGTDFTLTYPQRPSGGLPTDYPGSTAETTSALASINIPNVHVGRYYMYAVANMGALTPEQVGTPYQLKHIQLRWNEQNSGANNQMFGYFTAGASGGESQGFDSRLLTVSKTSNSFHAWLKRAASKVTVVYDASNMHNDIMVYVHSVTIHDIPRTCTLGADNAARSSADLITTGESIYYNSNGEQLSTDAAPSASQYEKWMGLGRGSGLKGAVDSKGVAHGENQTALYFFENLQGNYDGDPLYDKRQDPDSVGFIVNKPNQPGYKDNVPLGSYIEVDAFYVSNHAPVISSGKIKYRFMLGQDTKYDYDSFRNRHYKLTLKFNGYANQADWHIEYIEDSPEIYVPSKYYVSYIYNEKATFPVRITGNCTSLECEIIENNWAPYDPKSADEVPGEGELGTTDDSFQWNRQVWAGSDYTFGKKKHTYTDGTTGTVTAPHVGFLALTVPTAYENESTPMPSTLFNDAPHDYREDFSRTALENYYYGRGGYGKETNYLAQNVRKFDVSSSQVGTTITKGNGRNAYYVTKLEDGTTTLQMPLWTRPKAMVRISGFSGNNPFERYQRKAVVRIRATFDTPTGKKLRVKDVPVFQVRRIVNPKGVWRRYNNNDPFRVTLKYREGPRTKDFTNLISEGSWKAYIVKTNGKNFISLEGGSEVHGDTIYGDTDSPIDFAIKFKGITSQGESNCAIVAIEYHGFNCRHSIFVRQGYNSPLELVNGSNVHWSSYSVYAANHTYGSSTGTATVEMTVNPLALGSFFKRGNLNQGILQSNNTRKNVGMGVRENPGSNKFNLIRTKNRTSSATWANINGLDLATNSTYSWPNMKGVTNGKERQYTVPTYAQFNALAQQCDYGIGVLYADGATVTASTISDAYGFTDDNNNTINSHKGMRGIIVFNPTNANQVFFPLGAQGIGRRTIQFATPTEARGTLRYGALNSVLTAATPTANNAYRPLAYNIGGNPGAIYWLQAPYKLTNYPDDTPAMGWDMNYADLTFSFYGNAVSNSTLGGKGDALPLKLIATQW